MTWNVKEGEEFDPNISGTFKPVVLATVEGPARLILLGERTSLNVLARASGIGKILLQFSTEKKKHNNYKITSFKLW